MSQKTLQDLQAGIGKFSSTNGKFVKTMMDLGEMAAQDGSLSKKVKELIFVALAIQQKCEYCIAHHVQNAMQSGASAEEINEAAQVAIAMGGGPSLAYTATKVQDAIGSFSGQEEK